ncbi:MAG: ThuA domain-containing protein [Acidobacteria bacterium]|nr:ThuA domain-containing protein [Acidobacteriota bacterium]
MRNALTRRQFVKTGAAAGAAVAVPDGLFAQEKKSVLVFTKSSGFEHDVVKVNSGKPRIVEQAVRSLGTRHGFEVSATKDGRIFDSDKFHEYAAVVFFTTGDLTTTGTDKNPPMSREGKQSLLDAIRSGLGFVGVHAAADTFHTAPDTEENRYIAHGEESDAYVRMLGGEFITHGRTPRLQTTNLIVNDPKFPGLEGVSSPASFNDEWYSLKDFRNDLHVILTLDTRGMTGEAYQRPPYPMTWARMEGKGRVFYTAIGDRPENWSSPFFLNLLGGGIRWTIAEAQVSLDHNLLEVAPGFAKIPPPTPKPKSNASPAQ